MGADRVFVEFDGRCLSYADYNAAANRVARWAQQQDLGKGDVVALVMTNRPEYLLLWAGLAKLGVTTALINTNVAGDALSHVIREANCRAVIIGSECYPSWAELDDAQRPQVPVGIRMAVIDSPQGQRLQRVHR